MKIFISHSQHDEELAFKLRDILEKSKKMQVFVFQKKKRYGIPIDKKILHELDHSDYIVAIITVTSQNSSSVNQELGYAQAKGIEKIPMVEVGAPIGFLLHGTENLEFTRKDFHSKCIEVRDYIIENGPRRLFTEVEEAEIKKSAHYRYEIQYYILDFLGGMFYRLNMGDEAQRHMLFYAPDPEWRNHGSLNYLNEFFKKNKDYLIKHFSKIDFSMFLKLDNEYNLLVNQLKQAERFHHDIMPEEESDLITKLNEYIRGLPPENFNLRKYAEDWLDLDPDSKNTNCSEIWDSKDPQIPRLQNQISYIISDLKELTEILIGILEIHIGYQNKFGKIAFKH